MNDIHFSLIKITGFRGRNFSLKMKPRGQNTVFIMDGGIGKTTTIELLRWCFKYPESQCNNHFTHMWVDPAHVLDESKTTPQHCEIVIQFSAFETNGRERVFTFTRSVDGISERESTSSPDRLTSDNIREIHDSLEIDYGDRPITGDAVNEFLKQEFRFNDCVEFFCFDGEKARNIMQLASNPKSIDNLLTFVNQRATHPRIEEYKQRLNGLKNRILDEAKTSVSDKAQEILLGKLRNTLDDLRALEKRRESIKIEIAGNSLALKNLQDRSIELQNKITQAKADEIVQKLQFEMNLKAKTKEIDSKRANIYLVASQWLYSDSSLINELKVQVRERGDLPEPYRKNLISSCLKANRCEICGRILDDASKKHILGLQEVVAQSDVHTFLTSSLAEHVSTLDSEKERREIKSLIDDCKRIENQIKNVKLSDEDNRLFAERDLVENQLKELYTKDANLHAQLTENTTWITETKREVDELQNRNKSLTANKLIIDKIDEAISKVEAVGEAIKAKTIDIISSVISENVSYILGPQYSARLSVKSGLMLGEEGFYGRERGGYSARLILAYCFAEAMTLIDPIIVDTPSGNVGTHREKLAKHLVANHKQIILLCLPTEIADFGPYISSETIKIVNDEGEN